MGAVVPIQPTTLPEGWMPSDHAWLKAEKNYPLVDLQKFTEHFHLRIAQMPPDKQTSRNWDAKWLQWLGEDCQKFPKETGHGPGHRFPSARERKLEDDRKRDAENLRKARECLDRINARRSGHGFG